MSSTITGVVAARIPNENKDAIDAALNESGSKIRDVMIDFAHKLETGELAIKGNKIKTPLDLSEFLPACDEAGYDPQMVIDIYVRKFREKDALNV